MADRRSLFWPVLLGGGASAALASVASGARWAATDPGRPAGLANPGAGTEIAPAALALALVALAAWAALSVLRRRARLVVATLGAVASVLAAVAILRAHDSATQVGGLTGAYWTALCAAGLSALGMVVALFTLGHWPEMSSRYDAPTGEWAGARPEHRDLWRALDEGDDPTAHAVRKDRLDTDGEPLR